MPTNAREKAASTRTAWWILAVISVVALAVRLAVIGGRDFWFDECCTYRFVADLYHWPDDRLLIESTNLPYYVLVHAWTALFGWSEAAFRSLSAIASAATVPVIAWTAWQLGGRRVAVVAAMLLALHPLHVYYGGEARAYALWMLLISLAIAWLYRAGTTNRSREWLTWSLLVAFSLHLHYFTVFFLPASGCALWLAGAGRATLKRWTVWTCVTGVIFVPYTLAAVLPAARAGGSAWVSEGFRPADALAESLWSFLPAGRYPAHLRGLSLRSPDTDADQPAWLVKASQLIPVVVVVAMVALIVTRSWQVPVEQGGPGRGPPCESADPPESRFRGLPFAAALALLPPVLLLLVSTMYRPLYLAGRYEVLALPAAVLATGLLVVRFSTMVAPGRSGVVAAAVTILLVSCAAVPLERFVTFRPPMSFHHARAKVVASMAGDEDLIVTFTYDRDYLLYYLRREGFAGALQAFPTWLDGQVGWVSHDADLAAYEGGEAAEDAAELVGRLKRRREFYVLRDSMERVRSSRRSGLNDLLLEALRSAGCGWEEVSADWGILRVRCGGDGRDG